MKEALSIGALNRARLVAGAAGLAVKVGRFLAVVPEEMRRAADGIGLPLLEIPADIAYVDITHPLLGAIISRQTLQLQYSSNIRGQFTRMVLEGNGLEAVAGELARLIGGRVVMVGEDDRLLASASSLSGQPGAPAAEQYAAEEREEAEGEEGLQETVVPVLVKGIRYGALQTFTRQAGGGRKPQR
jgi:purine catabolism regulator